MVGKIVQKTSSKKRSRRSKHKEVSVGVGSYRDTFWRTTISVWVNVSLSFTWLHTPVTRIFELGSVQFPEVVDGRIISRKFSLDIYKKSSILIIKRYRVKVDDLQGRYFLGWGYVVVTERFIVVIINFRFPMNVLTGCVGTHRWVRIHQ